MSWLSAKVNPLHLIGMWAHNFSAIFLDTNHSLDTIGQPDYGTLALYGMRVFILIIAAYSVFFLYSQTARPGGSGAGHNMRGGVVHHQFPS
jgi:hypothetical protein